MAYSRRSILASAASALALFLAPALPASADVPGVARQTANVDGIDMPVYSYHPKGCAAPSILIIFHGDSRTAESYLESAIPLANRACFSLYAPLFDRDRFPNWSYQRGGLVNDGKLRSEDDWTVELAAQLVDWAQDQEGRPDAPSYLFGHSAGAQFLSRVAAYALPAEVDRIILANPSTYVLPTAAEQVPYGYGGLPDRAEAADWMRAYLAAPITIYLGEEDTGAESLTMTDAAQRQGANRLDRGEHTFRAAQKIAQAKGWSFNWRLVEAEHVGHSARGMLQSDAMAEALGN